MYTCVRALGHLFQLLVIQLELTFELTLALDHLLLLAKHLEVPVVVLPLRAIRRGQTSLQGDWSDREYGTQQILHGEIDGNLISTSECCCGYAIVRATRIHSHRWTDETSRDKVPRTENLTCLSERMPCRVCFIAVACSSTAAALLSTG